MFSSALKSFSSNITSNYSLSPQPTSICGPWKVYDGKKKSGGKLVSVFVFERKSLEPQAVGLRSTGGVGLKQAHEEVVERLRKEASSLARLRHPSILQLEEPVEDTQSGGLRFATEPITSSLAGLLEEKDERAGGADGRNGRYASENSGVNGSGRRKEVDLDELEIQKGLLQLAKGLGFLHESAGLVHANLTPDAIFINAKSDWKISGLGFSTPPTNAANPSIAPLALSEVLNHDPRLPQRVQLNIDYTSPDLVMDSNVTGATDLFSLGLVIIALYNSPHRSPLNTSMSLSTYKRMLSSPATTPTQRNNYLSTKPIPEQVTSSLLPRLITRRSAQRYGARGFQEAAYFDSILVSTLRFLDDLPAKTVNEKSQFLRGFPRIMQQFPKAVLEKKVLPALLGEMKDPELLSPILEDAFKILAILPNSQQVLGERVIPSLRQVFLTNAGRSGKSQERDTSKEGGLLVILENLRLIAANCSGKMFKDDVLPLVFLGFDSPTHSIQDTALQQLSIMLPILDFSTIKNEMFPVVAHVFSKTSSMAIKIRGLEAFSVLCGGSSSVGDASRLMGNQAKPNSSSAVLDKYTIQEKVVPLLKGIKTREPAVMMAALEVFKQVGRVADAPFLAFDVLPVLWAFSLGPLLNLDQFQEFMSLIKTLSTRIEEEQTRKLQQLGGRGIASSMQTRATNGTNGDETDFETLVTGRSAKANGAVDDSWESAWTDDTPVQPVHQQSRHTSKSSWSAPAPQSTSNRSLMAAKSPMSRAITPDSHIASFQSLQPSKPIQQNGTVSSLGAASRPQPATSAHKPRPESGTAGNYSNWPSSADASNPWAASSQAPSMGHQRQTSASNPWSSIPMSNNWSTQSNNLSTNLSSMKIDPPGQQRGPGGFGQTGQKQGGSLNNWDSLI